MKPEGVEDYEPLCFTASALVTATQIYIGQDFYNAGKRKEVVQAADFLIKEARVQQRVRSWTYKDVTDLLACRGFISIDEGKSRQVA
jgi:hypothetical protein